MIPVILPYITLIVLMINVAIAAAVWVILSAAVGRSGLTPSGQRAVRAGSAVFLGGWLAAALLLAPAPATLAGRDPAYITPLLPWFGAGSLAIVLSLRWLSASFRRVIAAIPLPALIGVQVYRVVGAVFLILLAQHQLPAHFALPAGWGDVAVGLAAPLVALALVRGRSNAPILAIAWNAIGLLDLVVAVGMGTGLLVPLLAPSLGPHAPSTGAMGVFPLILVPTFAVPLSVLLHLFALGRLLPALRFGAPLVPKAAS